MRISITSPDLSGDQKIQGTPWVHFEKNLELSGYEIVPLSENPDFIVFNNYSPRLWKKYGSKLNSNQLILISWEPPSNLPRNYRNSTLRKFKYRFFPSPTWADEFGGIRFNWPQKSSNVFQLNKFDSWDGRLNKFCFIQKNRWNIHSESRYGLRRRAVGDLASKVDVYGKGWNQGAWGDFLALSKNITRNLRPMSIQGLSGFGRRYENVIGQAEDKLCVMEKYKYSLIIENSPSYVSEKLFDAILAGTVPLYVGANLELFGIPNDIVIHAEPSIESITRNVQSMFVDRKVIEQVRINIRNFILSENYKKFELDNVFNNIAECVRNINSSNWGN